MIYVTTIHRSHGLSEFKVQFNNCVCANCTYGWAINRISLRIKSLPTLEKLAIIRFSQLKLVLRYGLCNHNTQKPWAQWSTKGEEDQLHLPQTLLYKTPGSASHYISVGRQATVMSNQRAPYPRRTASLYVTQTLTVQGILLPIPARSHQLHSVARRLSCDC